MPRTGHHLALCTAVIAILATTVSAQQPAPARTEKWEVSVHLTGLISTNPSGGTFTPPPGDRSLPLATGGSGPRTSSWFFADGAKLLNDVNAQLGIGPRVTPLDDTLGAFIVGTPNTMAVGFAVARLLSSRLTAEVTLDYSPTGIRAKDSVSGAVSATRTTFANAMRLQLDAGPETFPPPLTTSSGVRPGTGGQLLTIGALRFALTPTRRVTPFVVGGAGLASRFGELPTAGVKGNYSTFFGLSECACRLNETDDLQIRVAVPSSIFVGMVGLGLDYQPTVTFWRGRAENSSRWGIRVEARVYLGFTESETFIDTRPSSVTGPPPEALPDYPFSGVFVLGASPATQFSNDPPVTGFESSLSGQPLTNFRVFEGRGMRPRVAITTGLFVKF